MGTPADYQRSSDYRENRNLAQRVHADFLDFKFEGEATANAYTAVALTQVDRDGTEITSDDKRYALDSTAKIVAKHELINVCLDAEETDAANGFDIKIQVRNVGSSTWQDLTDASGSVTTGSAAQIFDDVDGHAELQVLVKSTTTDNAATAAGYLHIS